eukprot:1160390-Pelagomonas_calceolata.AAC.7
MKSMSSVAMIKAFNLRTARISSNWTLMSWLFAWLCPSWFGIECTQRQHQGGSGAGQRNQYH